MLDVVYVDDPLDYIQTELNKACNRAGVQHIYNLVFTPQHMWQYWSRVIHPHTARVYHSQGREFWGSSGDVVFVLDDILWLGNDEYLSGFVRWRVRSKVGGTCELVRKVVK